MAEADGMLMVVMAPDLVLLTEECNKYQVVIECNVELMGESLNDPHQGYRALTQQSVLLQTHEGADDQSVCQVLMLLVRSFCWLMLPI